MRYAIIRSGLVENVILWDGEADWNPGDDVSVIDCPAEVGIGWTHDEDGFQAPPEPVVEDPA